MVVEGAWQMLAVRILVVDDEASVGAVIGATLRRAGYSFVLARNYDEALRQFAVGPPFDLVLLDVMLAEGDGLALLEAIKDIQPETPAVMISGVPEIGVVISAMKKGAFDYLLKPIGHEQLLDAVRRALKHRELDRRDTLHRQSLERLVEARTEMLRRAIADLERSYDITLEALGNALDLKDSETEGHSKRVTAYSMVLARAMNMEPSAVK